MFADIPRMSQMRQVRFYIISVGSTAAIAIYLWAIEMHCTRNYLFYSFVCLYICSLKQWSMTENVQHNVWNASFFCDCKEKFSIQLSTLVFNSVQSNHHRQHTTSQQSFTAWSLRPSPNQQSKSNEAQNHFRNSQEQNSLIQQAKHTVTLAQN